MPSRSSYSRRSRLAAAAVGTLLAASAKAPAVVTFGQLDDFQDGTTMGWIEGMFTPNPPTNIPNGGPGGMGDAFLQNISSGGFGAGSKQIMFNQDQWTGDFNSAHVTRISGMMANQGTTTLHMRVGVRGGMFFTIYASANAIVLPADGGVWHPVTFELNTSGMALVGGSDSLQTVMGSVGEMRLLSAEFGPSFTGDVIVSTLGVDNLRAMTIPGDANFDGVVNLSDFNILAANFGMSGATWQQADFTFDGNVNLNDFNLLAANFGASAGPDGPSPSDWANLSAAIPEPLSAWSIALVAGACALRRARHSSSPRG